jgi:hypothetical protein
MNHQELVDIADLEIRLGAVDRRLMTRAQEESRGVQALANQIYWRLRADEIEEEAIRSKDGEIYLRDLKELLVAKRRKQRMRSSLIGWTWTITCFVSFAGIWIFYSLAGNASSRGGWEFYTYTIVALGCMVMTGVAFHFSRRSSRN